MDENERRIRQILRTNRVLNLGQSTLSGLEEYLEKTHGIEVVLDERNLADVGAEGDTPITALSDVGPLRVIIKRILEPLDLAYVVRGDVLMITSQDAATDHLVTLVYDVRALVGRPEVTQQTAGFQWWRSSTQPFFVAGQEAQSRLDAWDALIEVITHTVEPESWEDVGGVGSIQALPSRGALVISQTEWVQEQITDLLSELSALPVEDQAVSPRECSVALSPTREADAAIRRALNEKISLRFDNTPLGDVLELIREKHGIPVVVYWRRLEDLAVNRATPIALSVHDVTVRSALEHVLEPVDATFFIQDGVLAVISADEEPLFTRVYPVRDLVLVPAEVSAHWGRMPLHVPGEENGFLSVMVQPAGSARQVADFDTLIELITKIVEPYSWEDVGGEGVIEDFPSRFCLVVTQTQDIHDQIAALLTALRAVPVSGSR